MSEVAVSGANLTQTIKRTQRFTSPQPIKSTIASILTCALLFSSAAKAENSQSTSLFDLSIEDLLNVKVTIASLFEESELDAASSVSVITKEEWQQTGARRIGDVLEAVPSIATYPTWGGAEAIAIRGYATELSVRGIANTLDGVPLNSFTYATSLYDKPIINLAHLDRIEMIRGPGSTLYGTDAFHGVISHQLRSSDENRTSLEGSHGQSGYSYASMFASRHNDRFSFNGGLGINKQGDQNLKYRYTSPVDGSRNSSERDYEYRDLNAFATFSTGDIQSGELKLTTYISEYDSKEMPGIGTQFFARLPAFGFDIESTSLAQDKDHSGQDSNFWLASLDYKLALSDHYTLESKVYHWNTEQEWSFDNSSYPTSLDTLSGFTLPCRTATNGSPNPIYCPHTLLQSADEHRTGAQLYLKSYEKGAHTQWVLGLGQDRLKVQDTKVRSGSG